MQESAALSRPTNSPTDKLQRLSLTLTELQSIGLAPGVAGPSFACFSALLDLPTALECFSQGAIESFKSHRLRAFSWPALAAAPGPARDGAWPQPGLRRPSSAALRMKHCTRRASAPYPPKVEDAG